MFTLTLIAWSLVIAVIVSRYPKFFKKITAYRISLDSDSDSDSSVSDLSDTESDVSDTEEEEEEEEQSAAKVILLKSLDDYDKLPDYMKDFYEETVLSPEWMSLTEEQKRVKLDADLDNYRTKA
jgi:SepF-like predicted cell division protein (DUF552 family)